MLIAIIGFGIKEIIKSFVTEIKESKAEFIGEVRDLKDQIERMLIDNGSFTTACRLTTINTEKELEVHTKRLDAHSDKLNDHSERLGTVENKLGVKSKTK